MSEELKPCPWCKQIPIIDGKYCGTVFYKHACASVTFLGDIRKWNSRPIEDALRKRVKELEVALSSAKDTLDRIAINASRFNFNSTCGFPLSIVEDMRDKAEKALEKKVGE